MAYLERQVAQNHRPLYSKVAHNIAKVAHNYRLLAFQVVACCFGPLDVLGDG